jgi:hypothetical protein
MLGNNSVEIFKNYELYDYEIEPLSQEPGKYGCRIMHINGSNDPILFKICGFGNNILNEFCNLC